MLTKVRLHVCCICAGAIAAAGGISGARANHSSGHRALGESEEQRGAARAAAGDHFFDPSAAAAAVCRHARHGGECECMHTLVQSYQAEPMFERTRRYDY